ncbi:MAG: MptD family putative ECF transporter S component [Treponema sp.]|jgi:energy-coupling factor transport system substrate-specific component|nr:MptD family putative ECF transporter S component [Treponema sp.]
MNQNKLKAKDLITIAIFTVVFVIATFACVMALSMTVVGYPFLASASGLVCGVIWLYMRLKVPKRFTVLLQSIVCALLFFCIGAGWFIASGIVVGGALAELITSAGHYKSFKFTMIGYAVYGFCFHWGAFLMVILARDYYYDYALTNGTPQQHLDALMPLMSWQLLLGAGVFAVVGAVLGMLLGRRLLKKHFVKAGML